MSAGNYRTSSTPIWVCVSFSPRLARMQILPWRAICIRRSWWGYNYIAASRLSWWMTCGGGVGLREFAGRVRDGYDFIASSRLCGW